MFRVKRPLKKPLRLLLLQEGWWSGVWTPGGRATSGRLSRVAIIFLRSTGAPLRTARICPRPSGEPSVGAAAETGIAVGIRRGINILLAFNKLRLL